MSTAILALVVGTLLSVGALAFVLYPLFFGDGRRRRERAVVPRSAALSGTLAVAALREIEFDRVTGKLSDEDYAQLRDRYTREALVALREADRSTTLPPRPDDELEAVILDWRARHAVCVECGPRPEADALFCSTCGRYLPGVCTRCGERIDESGARFCRACGHQLAA